LKKRRGEFSQLTLIQSQLVKVFAVSFGSGSGFAKILTEKS
jgi:hypothetical protein